MTFLGQGDSKIKQSPVEGIERDQEEKIKQSSVSNLKSSKPVETEEIKQAPKEKKQVSFNEEVIIILLSILIKIKVQTKELPKKVSKFKQEMMDKRK